MTKDNILHLGNRSVRPNLGDRNCRIFVVVLASKTVQGISIVSAFLGTNPVGAILESGFALEINLIVAAAAGENSGIIHVLMISMELSFFSPHLQLRGK